MDTKWLKEQFEAHPGKSKSALAKATKLSASAISKILAGTRRIQTPEYHDMRRFFDLPVDGENAIARENTYVLEPLEHGYELQDSQKPADQDDWILPASLFSERTNAAPDQIKTFKIRENTMEPNFKLGERVVVDVSDQTPSPPGVFIISDGFGHLLRHCEILPGSKPPKVKLSTNNHNADGRIVELKHLEIVGRAIAKFQWL